MRSLESPQRLGNAGSLLDGILHRLEGHPQCLSNVRFVVNNQDTHICFC